MSGKDFNDQNDPRWKWRCRLQDLGQEARGCRQSVMDLGIKLEMLGIILLVLVNIFLSCTYFYPIRKLGVLGIMRESVLFERR